MGQADINFPPHNSRDTSIQAAASVRTFTPSIRDRVFTFIRAHGGATSDEVEYELKLSHQTASARIWELRRQSLITDGGKRRRTRSGRNAIVWRAL